MTPPATPERSEHHRFPTEIISHGVWLYYRFCLGCRDVEELLLPPDEITLNTQNRHLVGGKPVIRLPYGILPASF